MALVDKSLGYVPAQKAWKAGKKSRAKGNRIPLPDHDEIQKCLTCDRPASACHGCKNMPYGDVGDGKVGRPSKYDPETLVEMMQAGMAQVEIARAYGVTRNTVYRWTKKLKEDKDSE